MAVWDWEGQLPANQFSADKRVESKGQRVGAPSGANLCFFRG